MTRLVYSPPVSALTALHAIGHALDLPAGSDVTKDCLPAVKQLRGDSKLLNRTLHLLITKDDAFVAKVEHAMATRQPPTTAEELKQLLWDIVG